MKHVQPLRVQVLNNHILAQNLYRITTIIDIIIVIIAHVTIFYNYSRKPRYLIIGYVDPLGTRNIRERDFWESRGREVSAHTMRSENAGSCPDHANTRAAA